MTRSPEQALAGLLLAGADAASLRRAAAADPALGRALAAHAHRLPVLRALAAGVDHAAAADVAGIAAMFDRAVALCPEASVAAVSLGDPATLGRATAEIAAWLEAERLLRPQADAVDWGCGIGRVAAVLAARMRSVLGLDIAAGMVAEARRRHAGAANLRFAVGDGVRIPLPQAAADLVLAVDSLPYAVQAGVADAAVAEMARVLRPGGAIVLLNLSYRGAAADAASATAWAALHGLRLRHAGGAPFALWDGRAFVLERPMDAPGDPL